MRLDDEPLAAPFERFAHGPSDAGVRGVDVDVIDPPAFRGVYELGRHPVVFLDEAAFQYYGRMKTDRQKAWQDYLRLCRAGGTRGYFELLEVGDLLNPFQDGAVAASVGHVIEELQSRY